LDSIREQRRIGFSLEVQEADADEGMYHALTSVNNEDE